MKRIILCLLVITLLVGCGSSYAQDSTSKNFELSNVTLITLSGPNAQESDGTSVEIKPGHGDYAQLVQLVKGEKLDQCPTNNFGLCYITYTVKETETVKVYPANDGTNYVCLFSINPALSRYLELPEEAMKTIQNIFETNNIQVIY